MIKLEDLQPNVRLNSDEAWKRAEAMSTLGYVNAYGRGVIRSQDALARNGNPPAEFVKDEPTQFLAMIRRKP